MQHIKEVVLDKRLDDKLMDVVLRINKGRRFQITQLHGWEARCAEDGSYSDESKFPLLRGVQCAGERT